MAETPARRGGRAPALTQPALARIVHYSTTESVPRAAIITAVHEDAVDLVVFNHLGAHHITDVPHADEPTPGHYNWPPQA